MVEAWTDGTPGLVVLPSGRRVRGRSLRSLPVGELPTAAVHLAGRPPPEPPWERVWVRWWDFSVPSDPSGAVAALRWGYELTGDGRVEIACTGGVGRTGTGLAALCVLDGLSPDAAVAWVRSSYHRRSVEVPWQRRFLGLV